MPPSPTLTSDHLLQISELKQIFFCAIRINYFTAFSVLLLQQYYLFYMKIQTELNQKVSKGEDITVKKGTFLSSQHTVTVASSY